MSNLAHHPFSGDYTLYLLMGTYFCSIAHLFTSLPYFAFRHIVLVVHSIDGTLKSSIETFPGFIYLK